MIIVSFYDEVDEFYKMLLFDRRVILRRGYGEQADIATYIKNIASDLKEILDRHKEAE